MEYYVDFHAHTDRSDGALSPLGLVLRAKEAGVGVLAITDHNVLAPDLDALTREAGSGIRLIPGMEVSCTHQTSSGKQAEIHLVVLGYDKNAPALSEVARRNNAADRRGYVSAILKKLDQCGIELGDYDFIARKYARTAHLGRMSIAAEMTERGFVDSIDQAFDLYLSEHGEQRAYVRNPIRYVSLPEAVEAALADHGIPCLAHLLYYNSLTPADRDQLLGDFKDLAGPAGAMETEYAKYDASQRLFLRNCARRFDLVPSAGSDFHGQNPAETLRHHFPMEIYDGLRRCRERAFG